MKDKPLSEKKIHLGMEIFFELEDLKEAVEKLKELATRKHKYPTYEFIEQINKIFGEFK